RGAARAQVESIDVGIASGRHREDHAVSVRREVGGKRHAWKLAQYLALTGIEVEEIHPRPVTLVGHEGDLLARRRKAWREYQRASVGQISVVLPILIHDGQ